MIIIAARRVADLPVERMHERRIALGDRSCPVAYRIAAATLAAILVGVCIASDGPETHRRLRPPGNRLRSDFVFVVVSWATFLPSAVVAWYTGDSPGDTDDDVDPPAKPRPELVA